jgi:hypothetical protein
MNEQENTNPENAEWRYFRVFACLFVGFVFQFVMSAISTASLQMKFSMVFCTLVLLRTGVAALRHEQNRVWVFYCAFALFQGPLFYLMDYVYHTPASGWDEDIWEQISGCWNWIFS